MSCIVHHHAADKYSKNISETFADPALRSLVDVWNIHTYATLNKVPLQALGPAPTQKIHQVIIWPSLMT